MIRWTLSLAGLALAVFALAALSGPGRIDIEDGQARFEAGRNLVDHGDTCLRDDRLTWNKFPGRDGHFYTGYRLPQILVVAGCVFTSDHLGPVCEGRRHFYFSLHGAVCAALIAVLLAIYFRSTGLSPRASLGWAVLSIVATPCWHYATSTFDEILTSLVAIFMIVSAHASRKCSVWIIVSAIAAGVLYNCKPPIVALALPALALACTACWRCLAIRGVILFASVVAGWYVMNLYEQYKFPPEVRGEYDRIIREEHPPSFFGNVPEALLDLMVGPSSGMIWYCPPVVLILAGVIAKYRSGDKRLAISYMLAAIAIVGFVSLLVFYKGGVCWGPRYLTPLFTAGWIFAPAGAAKLGLARMRIIIVLGIVVQLVSLAAIPERLYIERNLPTGFYLDKPWWYFQPAIGHVFNRPREIADMMSTPPSPELTPAPAPTYTLPVFDPPYFKEAKGPPAVAKYQIINGPRMWWVWMRHARESDRPVDIMPSIFCILVIGITGIALVYLSGR